MEAPLWLDGGAWETTTFQWPPAPASFLVGRGTRRGDYKAFCDTDSTSPNNSFSLGTFKSLRGTWASPQSTQVSALLSQQLEPEKLNNVAEAGGCVLPYLSNQPCQAIGQRTGTSAVQILLRHWKGLSKTGISKIMEFPGWREKSVTETGTWVALS